MIYFTRNLSQILKHKMQLYPGTGFLHRTMKVLHDYNESEPRNELPKPPVPDLARTLEKYLDYAQVITTSENELNKTKQFVEEFLKNEGPVMQRKLLQLSIEENNWINRFWLSDMYLNDRLPLPVYSNPGYILLDQKLADQSDGSLADYAACTIHGIYDFKNLVDSGSVPCDYSTGRGSRKPLCMSQYSNLFTSYRHCLYPFDKLSTMSNNSKHEHIIIMHNNQAFLLETVVHGRLQPRAWIAHCILNILRQKQSYQEHNVALLTAVHRNKGAMAWKQLLLDEVNQNSLYKIETSSFVICLDENVYLPPDSPGSDAADMGRKFRENFKHRMGQMLHGNGVDKHTANRWFDKTPQFILDRHGHMGFNYEHSAADGIVIINLAEHVCKYVCSHLNSKEVSPVASTAINNPEFISWNITKDVQAMIEKWKIEVDNFIRSVDLVILFYNKYGKNFPKKMKISPDAYIQMALQWTYFRCHGRLVSTCESAGLRRFRQGRVDNIRPATPEVLAWIKTMANSYACRDMKKRAFQKALKKHMTVMTDTLLGYGIDNHMIALRELCHMTGKGLPKIFTDTTFNELFRFPLSTSHVAVNIPYTLAGYGAMVDDGYSCGYTPTNESITFSVASFHTSSQSDSTLFRKTLEVTLDDMKTFLEAEFPYGVEQ